MSLRARLILVVVWIASLAAIGTLVKAQPLPTPLPAPFVVSGADIGFRVTGYTGTTPTGELVVRINGQWVTPKFGGGSAAKVR